MASQPKTLIDTTCRRIKRAVIYARVSTDEQAAKGYSLPTQIEACEKYAEQIGLEVVATFKDDYTGTVPLEQRPSGRLAYEMLHTSQADVLIAYRIDRIVRPPDEGDEWDMPILIRGLAKLGKEIHTIDRGELKTDFASLLIAMLDAKGAGDERRKIIERTTRGRHKKLESGKIVRFSKPPYGYIFDGDMLAIEETEAAIVRTIYQWYILGDDDNREPMTDYAITRRLSEMGIPTPGEKSGVRRLRQSAMWNNGSVRRILTSETYAGVFRYGKYGSYEKGTKRVVKSSERQIAVNVPALVSTEVWRAAQTRRSHNKRTSGKKHYLLHGMVLCGCGRKMRGGTFDRSGSIRYRCNSNLTYIPKLEADQKDCHEKTVNGLVLESVVWGYVVSILTDSERFQEAWHQAQSNEQTALAPKRERLEAIHDLIKHCEQDATETAAALKKAKGLVLAKLQADMENIDDRYNKLTAERDRLALELQSGSRLDDEGLARALQFRVDVLDGLEDPTFDDKRLYLELLQVQVTVRDGRAVIWCAFPLEPLEVDLKNRGLTFIQSQIQSVLV